jgi:hypothetical protein
LADIGGSLGLYLGASVFTVIEIFWMFIMLCKRCICGGGKSRGKQKKDEKERNA